MVDGEIRSWLDNAHRDAIRILTKNKKTVEKLANELLNKETLTGEEIREIVFGKKSGAKPDAEKNESKIAAKKTTKAKTKNAKSKK